METYCISHPLSIISLVLMVMLAEVLPLTTAQSFRHSSPSYPYEIDGISSTVKIIIVALIFSMFLITFFSLYIHKCLNTSFENRLSLPNVSNRVPRLNFPHGLDQNILESFPVFLYSDVKELKIGKDQGLECAVCISEFTDHEHLRFLPKCHHVFHPECIDAWLASHTTCPVCRADLTLTDVEAC